MDLVEVLKSVGANAAVLFVLWASMTGKFYWEREIRDILERTKLSLEEEKERTRYWQTKADQATALAERSTSVAEKTVRQ